MRRKADSSGFVLLMALVILVTLGRPFFVADAYTRRILARHALVAPRASYAEVQAFLHRHMPREQALFNEFHALLVEIGKRYCRRESPRCEACPLREFLPPEVGSEARAEDAATPASPTGGRSQQLESQAV